MSTITSTVAANAAVMATISASSYRVKFNREQFLELVEIAKPRIIYHRGNNYFFAFDGFVIYTQQCTGEDFENQRVIESIELSNERWSA